MEVRTGHQIEVLKGGVVEVRTGHQIEVLKGGVVEVRTGHQTALLNEVTQGNHRPLARDELGKKWAANSLSQRRRFRGTDI